MDILKGKLLMNKEGDHVPVEEALEDKSIIALYFGASSCPPCKAFTRFLREFYQELREEEASFEIIYVSLDKTRADFTNFYTNCHGDWYAIPSDEETATQLRRFCNIIAIPQLVLFHSSGILLSGNGKADIWEYGNQAWDAWNERLKSLAPRGMPVFLSQPKQEFSCELQEVITRSQPESSYRALSSESIDLSAFDEIVESKNLKSTRSSPTQISLSCDHHAPNGDDDIVRCESKTDIDSVTESDAEATPENNLTNSMQESSGLQSKQGRVRFPFLEERRLISVLTKVTPESSSVQSVGYSGISPNQHKMESISGQDLRSIPYLSTSNPCSRDFGFRGHNSTPTSNVDDLCQKQEVDLSNAVQATFLCPRSQLECIKAFPEILIRRNSAVSSIAKHADDDSGIQTHSGNANPKKVDHFSAELILRMMQRFIEKSQALSPSTPQRFMQELTLNQTSSNPEKCETSTWTNLVSIPVSSQTQTSQEHLPSKNNTSDSLASKQSSKVSLPSISIRSVRFITVPDTNPFFKTLQHFEGQDSGLTTEIPTESLTPPSQKHPKEANKLKPKRSSSFQQRSTCSKSHSTHDGIQTQMHFREQSGSAMNLSRHHRRIDALQNYAEWSTTSSSICDISNTSIVAKNPEKGQVVERTSLHHLQDCGTTRSLDKRRTEPAQDISDQSFSQIPDSSYHCNSFSGTRIELLSASIIRRNKKLRNSSETCLTEWIQVARKQSKQRLSSCQSWTSNHATSTLVLSTSCSTPAMDYKSSDDFKTNSCKRRATSTYTPRSLSRRKRYHLKHLEVKHEVTVPSNSTHIDGSSTQSIGPKQEVIHAKSEINFQERPVDHPKSLTVSEPCETIVQATHLPRSESGNLTVIANKTDPSNEFFQRHATKILIPTIRISEPQGVCTVPTQRFEPIHSDESSVTDSSNDRHRMIPEDLRNRIRDWVENDGTPQEQEDPTRSGTPSRQSAARRTLGWLSKWKFR
ncbi:unnamed protein product [Notodromas monacha]|uniref:Thioredoxin domain-containing protein n=1 Tax=Notodromas monacha TaxID=399045 RepID=A0A7R9BGH2_9CRUS|nr:unnamed protein product [Notodromas monacha]CAG0915043.1 unnamed protein product [Notodromas monacha]